MTRFAQLAVLALVVLMPTIGFQNAKRGRSQQNRPPAIESFAPSKSVIDLCPFIPAGSCYSGTVVTLETKASAADDVGLTYQYSVSAGVIAGSGSVVNWELRRASVGKQTATVEVSDQRGRRTSATAQIDVVPCTSCDPPCPTLIVSCPSSVTEGDIVTFEALVGGDLPVKLTYLWSHSNGKRAPGQEGPELKIKALGSPGDVITATVNVLGLDPSCSRQALCKTRIEKQIR